MAKNCTNIESSKYSTDDNNTVPSHTQANSHENLEAPLPSDTTVNQTQNILKRSRSLISSNDSQSEIQLETNADYTIVNSKNKSGKIVKKTSLHKDEERKDDTLNDMDELDKKLNSIKNYLNQNKTLLNYVQFKSILENTSGIKDPTDIILQYTPNISDFIKFVQEDIYINVRNSSIKHKCTRLLNKLNNYNATNSQNQTPVNSDSDN